MFNPLTPYLTMKELKFSTRNAILDIFLDVRAYIADVFGGDSDDVTLDWNAVEPVFTTSTTAATSSSACGNAPTATSESLT